MDATDQKIVSMLNADGRISNNTIARELGISEGTVRNRIKRLIEAQTLRVSGQINPESISDHQLILLGVKVSVSKDLSRIADVLSQTPGVLSVCITTGRYDLMVELWLPVKHGLIDFIDGPLGHLDGVVATESFLAMRSIGKWISPLN